MIVNGDVLVFYTGRMIPGGSRIKKILLHSKMEAEEATVQNVGGVKSLDQIIAEKKEGKKQPSAKKDRAARSV